MRDASPEPAVEGFRCPCCARFIPTEVAGLFRQRRSGSPRRFCSPSCRQAAYRRRHAGVAESLPLQHRGGRGRRLRPQGDPPDA